MKLTDLNLSYPYIKYEVSITHVTSRRSTAIEWIILEAVLHTEKNVSCQELPVEDFFFSLFGISDTNQIIKPVLIGLRELGALILDDIYDDTDMRTTPMKCIHLTPNGASMQKVEKLPGIPTDATHTFLYDIVGKKIIQTGNIEDEPKGIKVSKIENTNDVAFPITFIKQEIMNLGSKKLNWFNDGTEIIQISPTKSDLKWKTFRRNLCIEDDFSIYIEGISDKQINEEVLEICSTDFNLAKLPDVHFSSLSELDKIGELKNADTWIQETAGNTRIYISDVHSYSLLNIRPYSCSKGEYNVTILCGCESLDVTVDEKGIFVKIPEQILPIGNKFLSSQYQISIGSFWLHTGEIEKPVNLAYSINKSQPQFSEIIFELIEKYYNEKPELIFLYHALGKVTEFNNYIKEYINSSGNNIEVKLNLINLFNDKANILFGKKCISDCELCSLLINKDEIALKVHDIQSAIKIIHRYTNSYSVKKRETLVEEIIHIVIECIENPESLQELHQLWQNIMQIGKKYINVINRNNWYKHLYTKKILQGLAEQFGNNDLYSTIEEYTSYERCIHDIQSIVDRCKDLLPEISFSTVPDELSIRKQIINNSANVKELFKLVDKWKLILEKENEFILLSMKLTVVSEIFSKISLALSMYYHNEDNFSKICVLDTSALMHDSDIFTLFDNSGTMVIIPQIVLTELDGLKADEDAEKAFSAKQAIRQINNYQDYEWLNLQEESVPELLSKDLDPKKTDNKIISVALKFITKMPFIISDDNNMRNLAVSQKIEAISSISFRKKLRHEHEEKSKKEKKKKKKK